MKTSARVVRGVWPSPLYRRKGWSLSVEYTFGTSEPSHTTGRQDGHGWSDRGEQVRMFRACGG